MEKKRSLRTNDLIATFEDGFAKDWFYAVGDFFRDHLDIFLTDRVIKDIGPDGKEHKRVKKVWTQGDLFTFDQGYLVVFIAKFPEAVYVLHAFQKKTQKTPKKNIAVEQQRLKQLEEERRHLP